MEICEANTTRTLTSFSVVQTTDRAKNVPEVALRVGACGAKQKTRPAKCQIDKAGGFSYNGFSGWYANTRPRTHEVTLTYSP